jgi:F-type H+-transporting ATPase subunit b
MQFDGTFFLIIASFVVFMLLMRAIYFEPIRRIKDQRERKKLEDREQADSSLAEYTRLQEEYEASLRDARRRAQQVILEVRQGAKKTASETVGKAREEVRQDLERQMAELARWREEAYGQLAEDRRALAGTIIQKITAGRIPAGSKS